jgi:serine/threonine protein kinase
MAGHLRLAPGDVFAGVFEIREVLAEGGMGTVYAARDRSSGEDLALKVLLPELLTEERSRHRFVQEARVLADLRTPYVPRIHRTGIDDASGQPFIAMDLLHGRDLRRYVDEHGAIGLEDARPLLLQLAEALAAAHRSGLVHRDLKPENVFLEDIPGAMRVKLLDFGVAKILDLDRTSATGTGAVGSPMWMAPEQTSAGGRIAPSTDVWAFGLLTFYVLTGCIYWKTMHDGSGIGGLLREMHVDPVEPPSVRAAELAPEIQLPPGLDDFFARALTRDHAVRFRDADEMLPALKVALHPSRLTDRSAMAYAPTMEVSTAAVREAAARLPERPGASMPVSAAVSTAVSTAMSTAAAHPPRPSPPAPEPAPPAWTQHARDLPTLIPATDPPPEMIAPRRRAPLWAWLVGAGALAVVGAIVAMLSAIIVWAILVATRPGVPHREEPPPPVAPVTDPAIPSHPQPMEPLPVAPG